MSECYPTFKDGQVLTSRDLNAVNDYHLARQDELGRMLGFGIACGLEGSIAGSVLTFTAGHGLDQLGRYVELAEANIGDATFDLDSATLTTDPSFPFVDDGQPGVTAVLHLGWREEHAAGDCTTAGCETHADMRCREPRVVLVQGRLRELTFAWNELLLLGPIEVTLTGGSTGASVGAVRKLLTDGLGSDLSPAARQQLVALTLTGTPYRKSRVAAVLNTVLWAARDYVVCRWYRDEVLCHDYTGEPGIALGWATNTSGTWRWDCRYRHDFAVSSALYKGINAETCETLCGRILAYIENVLLAFVEEPVADPGDGDGGGNGGGGGWVPPCKPHKYLETYLCEEWEIPPWLLDKYKVEPIGPIPPGDPYPPLMDKLGPLVNPPPEDYEHYLDPAATGIFNAKWGAGTPPDELAADFFDKGGVGDVTILPEADATAVEGLVWTNQAVGSDRVYLFHDRMGNMTSMGVVPTRAAIQETPQLGAKADTAVARADEAIGVATAQAAEVAQLDQAVTNLSAEQLLIKGRVDGLAVGDTIDQAVGALRVDLEQAFATQLATTRGELLGLLNDRTSPIGQGVAGLEGKVEVLSSQLEQHGVEIENVRQQAHADVQVARGEAQELMKQASAETKAMTERLTTVYSDTSNRVDAVFRTVVEQGTRSGFEANRAIASAIKTMSDAVIAAAPASRRTAVRRQVGDVQKHIDTLRGDPTGQVAANAATIEQAFRALSQGLKAAGAPTATVTRVNRAINQMAKDLV